MNQSDNGQSIQEERERRKRITKIKRMIIIVVIAAILLPTVLSVYLIIKVAYLEKKVEGFLAVKEMEYAGVSSLEMEERLMGTVMDLSNAQSATVSAPSIMEEENGEGEGTGWPKKVYLTFDDGPSIYTGQILDTLNKYGVKATFFVNGKTDEISKEGYKRIVEEGHTLAMHSYTHVYKEVYASKEAFLEDVYRLQNYLFDLTGTKPIYYRFPGGSSNTISEMDMQIFIQALHEEGMEYFDWNVANGDGGNKELTTDQILTNVWNDIPKYEHSMILMHDSVQKGFTVEALPEMIKQLQEAGYTILPIDDTTPLIQHIRDNSIENNSQ